MSRKVHIVRVKVQKKSPYMKHCVNVFHMEKTEQMCVFSQRQFSLVLIFRVHWPNERENDVFRNVQEEVDAPVSTGELDAVRILWRNRTIPQFFFFAFFHPTNGLAVYEISCLYLHSRKWGSLVHPTYTLQHLGNLFWSDNILGCYLRLT